MHYALTLWWQNTITKKAATAIPERRTKTHSNVGTSAILDAKNTKYDCFIVA